MRKQHILTISEFAADLSVQTKDTFHAEHRGASLNTCVTSARTMQDDRQGRSKEIDRGDARIKSAMGLYSEGIGSFKVEQKRSLSTLLLSDRVSTVCHSHTLVSGNESVPVHVRVDSPHEHGQASEQAGFVEDLRVT